MRKVLTSLLKNRLLYCICIVFAMLVVQVTASMYTLTGTELQVTNAAADQFDPAISGNIIVYTDFSGVDADVWYTDLETGLSHTVSNLPGDQQLTGVSDNRIVFTDWNSMDVMVYDVATGQTQNLTNGAYSNSLDPVISHNIVVWTDDRHANAEIYAKDLSTGEERRITNDLLVDQSPAVRDGIIVWERCDGYASDIYAYEWATGNTIQLTNTSYISERFPDVYGRTVVFRQELGTPVRMDVAAVSLDNPTNVTVLDMEGDQDNPRISGDFVSLNDSASGTPHIGLWQLSTGNYYQVTQGTSGQYLNDIDGNRIVYSDYREGQLDIYMFTFSIQNNPDENNYVFGGFMQPINEDGSSIFKLGRTIPVKITLSDCNGQSISSAKVTISAAKISDEILGTETEMLLDSPGNANIGNEFRYDSISGEYIYNLSTKDYGKGTYKVYVKVNDNQSYSVTFSLQ